QIVHIHCWRQISCQTSPADSGLSVLLLFLEQPSRQWSCGLTCPKLDAYGDINELCRVESLCFGMYVRGNCACSISEPPSHGPSESQGNAASGQRSEEHTSELQSPDHLVCRLLLE